MTRVMRVKVRLAARCTKKMDEISRSSREEEVLSDEWRIVITLQLYMGWMRLSGSIAIVRNGGTGGAGLLWLRW